MSETVVQVVSITPPRVSSKELATCTGLLMQICKWRLRELVGLVAALQARIEQRSERLYVMGIWERTLLYIVLTSLSSSYRANNFH